MTDETTLRAVQATSQSLWEEYEYDKTDEIEEIQEIDVADIVIDVEAPDLQSTYSYFVPTDLQEPAKPGTSVHLVFHGRDVTGYVIRRRRISSNDPLRLKLRPVLGIVENSTLINSEQLNTVEWMSEHYVCDLLSAIRCVAPMNLGSRVSTRIRLTRPDIEPHDAGDSMGQAHVIAILKSLGGEAELDEVRRHANLPAFSSAYSALEKKRIVALSRSVTAPKTVAKKVKAYMLAGSDFDAGGGSNTKRQRSPQQQRVIDELTNRARANINPVPVPGDELILASQSSSDCLRRMVARGILTAHDMTVHRSPTSIGKVRTTAPSLMPEQVRAVETLQKCVESREARTVLLFGVTASGKTEVYLHAIAHTLATGRNAIVLVPEIALTAQVVDVFVGRFGHQVAVLHSKLSDGERHDEWRRIETGTARIVVGARSAIFAPVSNVGLIVVDEEHEASYKQDNTPRYSAKEVARRRAFISGATLLLGSATPSLESYYASETGQITRIEMRNRIDNRPLPTVEVVDLREEYKVEKALFSRRLISAMEERLKNGQQTILFLNRRGFAQFVLCRDCGWAAKCPNCAVSLAFHSYDRVLKCHHCEYTGRAPQTCPDCLGNKVRAFGIGTEKVEEEVLRLFPTARVSRMDRDTTGRKGAHSRIVREFRAGEAQILIGTQMVAKGLDFPNVTLVGVVSADTSINMPDFRAAERTFQLLTQVAGRAGRGSTLGEVIIQTFSPDHYAVQSAMNHDYRTFYDQEILFRQELRYPPFSTFANLIAFDEIEAKASKRAELLAKALRNYAPEGLAVIGPAPAPLSRLRNQFRYHVALQGASNAEFPGLIRKALSSLSPADRMSINVDMDPLSMS